jgi:hypothetical protein
MAWYRTSKQIFALRKHVMRVDLHVHAGDLADFTDEQIRNQAIKSILSAAVIQGLDLIGIVSHDGPQMGNLAIQISKKEQYDLFVLAGHEYVSTDKFRLIAYNIQEPVPANLTFEQASRWAHENKGYVMVTDVTRRQAQILNKVKGTISAPDAIELYNTAIGSYADLDVDPDYLTFVNSAAKSAANLESTNVFTLINRKDLEASGLLPKGEGMEYVPKYLQRADEQASAQEGIQK